MFTDKNTTPVRLEVLVDLVRSRPTGIKRTEIYELLQPSSIPGPDQKMTILTLRAALDLGLAEEEKEILLSKNYVKKRTVKENILSALDEKVLTGTEVEPFLGLFYAYYLGLNKKIYERFDNSGNGWVPSLIDDKGRVGQTWANHFKKDVFNNIKQDNQFNVTKYDKAVDHWYSYMGLGWHDPRGQFMPDPTERLLRALPSIFGSKKKLDGNAFMEKLAESCPELDGGKLFLEANKYQKDVIAQKQCTLGLSQALVGLHEDQVLLLDCPKDSTGWDIMRADPPRDDTIKANCIAQVDWRRK